MSGRTAETYICCSNDIAADVLSVLHGLHQLLHLSFGLAVAWNRSCPIETYVLPGIPVSRNPLVNNVVNPTAEYSDVISS